MIGFQTLVLVVALAAGQPPRFAAPPQAPADLEAGRGLFVIHCARCHGIDGGGGEGPGLVTPELFSATTEDELYGVIRSGIPGTSMPGLRYVSDDKRRQLTAYVWSLGRVAAEEELPGDPEAGALLYEQHDCAACHVIGGKGGTLGPDLGRIGLERGADHLRESIVDPGATLPPSGGGAGSIYLMVRVETRDGRQIEGMRVNEDSFTIQIRDAESDTFHSVRKENIVRLQKRFGFSLMPSYRNMIRGSELDDMIAYLASLQGKQ